jgi:ergothioneine biosynthesis protein EgtB
MSHSIFQPADIHDPVAMRRAGPDVLSLALMDARNRTLQWLGSVEGMPTRLSPPLDADPPVWLVGQAGRIQELWIARNPQRARGSACPSDSVRLASIDPVLDWWLDPLAQPRVQRWSGSAPAGEAMRAYLAATLEATLELLEKVSGDDDEALYFYRMALVHEDRLSETLAATVQALGFEVTVPELRGHPMAARVRRDPLGFGAQKVMLGTPPGGWVPDAEQYAHEATVPEFEIDAQPVTWAEFAEFVDDRGYDDPTHWSPAGWAWVEATGRRAPRYVEQFAHGVLVHRQGRLQRVPSAQPAIHLSWYEADAWCRWAGRRLPTEAEYTLASRQGRHRGFVWGDVAEWMAEAAWAYPGHRTAPVRLDPAAPHPAARVLRGASCMTVARQHYPDRRRFAAPASDDGFCGFRSCAV